MEDFQEEAREQRKKTQSSIQRSANRVNKTTRKVLNLLNDPIEPYTEDNGGGSLMITSLSFHCIKVENFLICPFLL